MDATPIEFWFDFSSGYAYFAAQSIDELAARHGRTVLWRPFMLGVIFKTTGAAGLTRTPLKGDYARHDWARLSRFLRAPFRVPERHPIAALAASRAYYWIEEHVPHLAHAFARGVFHAYYVDGVDIAVPGNVAAVAAPLGIPREPLIAGMTSEAMKARLKAATAEALEKGVFGSPFFRVGDEPFWGWDRMPMLEAWLERGGW